MTKYIELIDKYEIRQSDSEEYNPPSYIWRDNTGEIIRCKDCKHWDESFYYCRVIANNIDWKADDYCSLAERKEE